MKLLCKIFGHKWKYDIDPIVIKFGPNDTGTSYKIATRLCKWCEKKEKEKINVYFYTRNQR